MKTRPILVTGASGMLGRRLVERLVRDGSEVRGLVRSEAAALIVERAGAMPVAGDVLDPDSLHRAAHGCDHVVHCAGAMGASPRVAPFAAVNVDGTANALAAAAAAGVTRFVHVGAAMCLLGGRRPIEGADESWPIHEPSVSGYAATKTRAERSVLAASTERLATVVVRPAWIWGTPDDPQAKATADAVRAGQMRLIDSGRYSIVTSHIDNTVEALILALERGRPGRAYFAFDDETVTIADFLGQLMTAFGLTLPAATVPALAARTMAAAMDAIWRLTRRPGDPPITRLLVALNSGHFVATDQRARDELGYRPILTRAEGMARLATFLAATEAA